MEIISKFTFNDMMVIYFTEEENVEWVLVPYELCDSIQFPERLKVDSLVQAKLVGDDYPKGFVTGHTMRNSQTVKSLRFVQQTEVEQPDGVQIDTILEDHQGNHFIHHVSWQQGWAAIKTWVTFRNQTKRIQKIEMLASFSLSCLSPFENGNQPGTLDLVRYRSKWSFEGKRLTQPIEALQLEPSWKPSGVGLEKYGQIGSMPVRGYFPYVGIVDKLHQISWSAKLAIPGSWQMEVYRLDEDLCLSGGLADRDFGDWLKEVAPGDSFDSPEALLTVVNGAETIAAQRLLTIQQQALAPIREQERRLPIQFNEFCTTWGKPTEKQIMDTVEVLKDKQIGYYVIDAGWYANPSSGWERSHGDWLVNEEQFPNGLEPALQAIRKAGMIPGIWFEIETVGRDAIASQQIEHLLQRDGFPLTCGDRRFWDMRDPWVQHYLTERVIHFLEKYQFGYLKIDYNENFGKGFDDATLSMGEAGRTALMASQQFIRQIKQALPDLVIENCSSGGHRLEPSMMALTDLSSFSDAHEAACIPIIAANLHFQVLPQQSLIWAVLRKNDSPKRLYYSMSATFMGRICLSGDINELNPAQWQIVEAGLSYYEGIKGILIDGQTTVLGPSQNSYRSLEGYQVVLREAANQTLAVIHQFDEERIILSKKLGKIVASYGLTDQDIQVTETAEDYLLVFPEKMTGCSLLFEK